MRIFLSFIFFFASIALQAQSVRFMSYNIRNGKGMDNKTDISRIVEVLKKAKPDLCAIEELDSVSKRVPLYLLEEIAKEVGMNYYYCPAISFQGGKYGIGMLTREAPLNIKRYALPGREESRALLVVEFIDYIYCATHLSLTEADRIASLPIIMEAVADMEPTKPLLIAGDFNATPDSKFIEQLSKGFYVLTDTTVPTYPAKDPNETIDYVCLHRRTSESSFVLKQSVVMNEPLASDHRPVYVDIELKKTH